MFSKLTSVSVVSIEFIEDFTSELRGFVIAHDVLSDKTPSQLIQI